MTISKHFKTFGIDRMRYTDERDALIIDAFSLVSFLVVRYYHNGLPLLRRLPSVICYLANTIQKIKTSNLCYRPITLMERL